MSIEAAELFEQAGLEHHAALKTTSRYFYTQLRRGIRRGKVSTTSLETLNSHLSRHLATRPLRARNRPILQTHLLRVEDSLRDHGNIRQAVSELNKLLADNELKPPTRVRWPFVAALALAFPAAIGVKQAGEAALATHRFDLGATTYKLPKLLPLKEIPKNAEELFKWLNGENLHRERRFLLAKYSQEPADTIADIMDASQPRSHQLLESPVARRFTGEKGLENRLKMLLDLHQHFLLAKPEGGIPEKVEERIAALQAIHTPVAMPIVQAEPGTFVLGSPDPLPAKLPIGRISFELSIRYTSLAEEYERTGNKQRAAELFKLALNMEYERLDSKLANDTERERATQYLRANIERLTGSSVPAVTTGRPAMSNNWDPVRDLRLPLYDRLKVLTAEHRDELTGFPLTASFTHATPLPERLRILQKLHSKTAVNATLRRFTIRDLCIKYRNLAREFERAGDFQTSTELNNLSYLLKVGLSAGVRVREYHEADQPRADMAQSLPEDLVAFDPRLVIYDPTLPIETRLSRLMGFHLHDLTGTGFAEETPLQERIAHLAQVNVAPSEGVYARWYKTFAIAFRQAGDIANADQLDALAEKFKVIKPPGEPQPSWRDKYAAPDYKPPFEKLLGEEGTSLVTRIHSHEGDAKTNLRDLLFLHGGLMPKKLRSLPPHLTEKLDKLLELHTRRAVNRRLDPSLYHLGMTYTLLSDALKRSGEEELAQKTRRLADKLSQLAYHYLYVVRGGEAPDQEL